MTHTDAEKKQGEEVDVRAALKAVGISEPILEPGDDPPDFLLRLESRVVPVEHTRLYLDDGGSSPQARARRWQRLRALIREAALPVELELAFEKEGGWDLVPPSSSHAEFSAALIALVRDRPAPFVFSSTGMSSVLSPFLRTVCGHVSNLKGEVSGTPDATFLTVPPFNAIEACIAEKVRRLQGKVSGAWLIIVLGADLSQPVLGVGELDPELIPCSLHGTPFERVYVIDISWRVRYMLQDGAWWRAV